MTRFKSQKKWEILAFVFLCIECQNYQNLTSADRKATFQSQKPYLCDSSLGPGWFHFQGDAGVRMPTSCVPGKRCGSHATGWLNGTHPSVADGVVTRQVCFHWKEGGGVMDCCYRFKSFTIQVVNCGSYFVYHFQGTPQSTCSLRYCGTDWGSRDKVPFRAVTHELVL